MMISPSESAGEKIASCDMPGGVPIRLLEEVRRTVSRLEFQSLEWPEIVPEVEDDGANVLLKEEMAVLGGQLRSQAAETAIRIEAARSEAKAEARREMEMEMEKRVVEERAAILKVSEAFLRERAAYFAGIEGEVVKLALAIAARVLHREAKLDPLLLAGVVRVALEKVAEDSATVLRVPVDEVEMWREIFVESPESALQLLGDDRLGAGECVLDTNVGRVELGVSAQLAEIERGFFDLIQQRPA
jgi:flagellar assembly protein FliH